MRCIVFLLFLVCSIGLLSAQNLIPNGSFELIDSCPTLSSQADRATGWSSINSSPDLHSPCAGEDCYMCVPNNWLGYQTPKEGDNYVSVFYLDPFENGYGDGREYIQCELNETLIAGGEYSLVYYASLADRYQFACDQLGVDFCDTAIVYNPSIKFGNVEPECQTPEYEFIVSKNAWTEILDTFTAVGGERFMTVGSFPRPWDLNKLQLSVSYYKGTSYYFDDFNLVRLQPFVSGDSVICYGDTAKINFNRGRNVSWYEVSDLNISLADSNVVFLSPTVSTEYVAIGELDTLYFTIEVIPLPIVDLGEDTVKCEYHSLRLKATNAKGKFEWSTGNMYGSVTIQDSGYYWIKETIGECSNIDSIHVSNMSCEPILILPNIITPNGDGLNDELIPKEMDNIQEVSYSVFNRWGEKVFRTDHELCGWGAEGLSDGLYYVVAEYFNVYEEQLIYKGWVEVVR